MKGWFVLFDAMKKCVGAYASFGVFVFAASSVGLAIGFFLWLYCHFFDPSSRWSDLGGAMGACMFFTVVVACLGFCVYVAAILLFGAVQGTWRK